MGLSHLRYKNMLITCCSCNKTDRIFPTSNAFHQYHYSTANVLLPSHRKHTNTTINIFCYYNRSQKTLSFENSSYITHSYPPSSCGSSWQNTATAVEKPPAMLEANAAPIAIPSVKLWSPSPITTIHATELSVSGGECTWPCVCEWPWCLFSCSLLQWQCQCMYIQ